MTGELKIVVSADLGEFGPSDGRAIIYRFRPIYHMQAVIPWLLFGLAFVALKENRAPKAALMLIPVALLGLLYATVTHLMRISSGSLVQLNAMFTAMVLGFAMVWLLAERVACRNRLVTGLLSLLVYFAFLGACLLSNGFGEDMMTMALCAAISIMALFLAFLIAASLAGESFKPAPFLIFLPGALFLSLLTLFLIATVAIQTGNHSVFKLIMPLLLGTFVAAMVYYAATVPFMVLFLTSTFWRKRFDAITRKARGRTPPDTIPCKGLS